MAFDKIKYDNEYAKMHYVWISLHIPKGTLHEVKQMASDYGMNVTQFILSAVTKKYQVEFK